MRELNMKRSNILFLVLFTLVLTQLASACDILLPRTPLKPQTVIEAFKAAGLEAENPFVMTPQDYGLAPLADEGIRFFIPSICSDCGGRVLYYQDKTYLEKANNYYITLGKESAILFSWVFMRENILVQINGDLPEAKAKEYERILNEIK